MAILEVTALDVTYLSRRRPPFHAVKHATLRVDPGEVVGLVGESGSGKSTLGTAVIRLLDPPGTITGGSVVFDGRDITRLPDDQLRPMRWTEISTVFQSSMNSLNPVANIGAQFKDVIAAHTDMTDRQIAERTAELLRMVDIDPSFVRFYPHELSGGMKQRVALALSLALTPKFVLLDEPTTGLDVVVQRSILENLKRIQRDLGFAVLIISHDLGAIMEVADRVIVMYNGELIDDQPARDLLLHPQHDYSRMLIGAYEELWKPAADAGRGVDAVASPPGRAPATVPEPERLRVTAEAAQERPGHANPKPAQAGYAAMHRGEKPVLVADNVSKHYIRRRGFKKTRVDAVADVSFQLHKGHITALVGQSGSGKSTIGRLVTGVERPDEGTITFGTTRVDQLPRDQLKEYRTHVQLVFQDPYSALNPAHTVMHSLSRPLANFKGLKGRAARERVHEMLEQVGLVPASRFADTYPHQLSGGQRQRVVVARALAPGPEVLIADEPTSMLDVSIRAEILEILNRLVRDQGIAMLYITHDLLSARMLADEILVLNKGRVVESGDATSLIAHPQHEYTQLLLSSIPNPFAEGMVAD